MHCSSASQLPQRNKSQWASYLFVFLCVVGCHRSSGVDGDAPADVDAGLDVGSAGEGGIDATVLIDAGNEDAGSEEAGINDAGSDTCGNRDGGFHGGVHGGCEEEAEVLLPMLVDALVAYYEGVGVCDDVVTRGCTEESTHCTLNSASTENTPHHLSSLIDWGRHVSAAEFGALDFQPSQLFCRYSFYTQVTVDSAECGVEPPSGVLYVVEAVGDDDGDSVPAIYRTNIEVDAVRDIETHTSTRGCAGE